MIAPSIEENKLRSSNFSRKQLQHFGRLSLVNLQLAFLTLYIQPESGCRVDSRISGGSLGRVTPPWRDRPLGHVAHFGFDGGYPPVGSSCQTGRFLGPRRTRARPHPVGNDSVAWTVDHRATPAEGRQGRNPHAPGATRHQPATVAQVSNEGEIDIVVTMCVN
jgi:hypothetical protein